MLTLNAHDNQNEEDLIATSSTDERDGSVPETELQEGNTSLSKAECSHQSDEEEILFHSNLPSEPGVDQSNTTNVNAESNTGRRLSCNNNYTENGAQIDLSGSNFVLYANALFLITMCVIAFLIFTEIIPALILDSTSLGIGLILGGVFIALVIAALTPFNPPNTTLDNTSIDPKSPSIASI